LTQSNQSSMAKTLTTRKVKTYQMVSVINKKSKQFQSSFLSTEFFFIPNPI
jgi:hypothetical protein